MFGIGLASMMAGSQESSKAIPPATISFGQLRHLMICAAAHLAISWTVTSGQK